MAAKAPDPQRHLLVTPTWSIPIDEFHFAFSRSSGPGGQNVNKVNSKATLRWQARGSPSLPSDAWDRLQQRYRRRLTERGELVVSSQRFRDAGRNASDCLEKLRALLLEIAVPPKVRRPTKPSRASRVRRLEEKRLQKRRKESRRTETWS